MRPVAILRHSPIEGPGYFAIFLERHGIPWRLVAIDEGEPVPAAANAYAGLCFLGGPMSVNDPLPWIEPACTLIRDAAAQGIPVIGHCLGGQLMSKAMGGQVARNPVKEIGWGEGKAESDGISRHWLGEQAGQTATVFQWHGETFSIPPGAARILGNGYCANQIFVLGPHLAMQCHVEMTPEMIAAWASHGAGEIAACARQPSVQTREQMLEDIGAKLPNMRRLADQLYSVWIGGIQERKRGP
ncbi:MAG: type 1 glutamine amidotransferase [Rhodocyclaceae bacterium]|nr:type 1 glutamine amidotransferase [Rhodocyclaceae bacterium]